MNRPGIDTVAFQAVGSVDQRDRAMLGKLGYEWKEHVVKGKGGATGDSECFSESFTNRINGLRVWIGLSDGEVETVRVEGSLPRVMGLTNDRQAELSEVDAQVGFSAMTEGLLPWSTEKLRSPWHCRRLDLAMNFEGPVAAVVDTYAKMRHPAVRRPVVHHPGQSCYAYGDAFQWIIYDKGREKNGARDAGHLGRVEFRWRGSKGIGRFLHLVSLPSGDIFRFMNGAVGWHLPVRLRVEPVKVPFQFWVPLDYRVLTEAFRAEVLALGDPGRVREFSSTREVVLDALQRDGERYASVWRNLPKATKTRLRSDLRDFRAREGVYSLPGLLWPSEASVA